MTEFFDWPSSDVPDKPLSDYSREEWLDALADARVACDREMVELCLAALDGFMG